MAAFSTIYLSRWIRSDSEAHTDPYPGDKFYADPDLKYCLLRVAYECKGKEQLET
jgi:hypothetical protein